MTAATKAGNKLNVFISYSRDDLSFSDQLDAALDLTGFDTTIDRHGISGGEDWRDRLGALIRDADTVVFVLSPSSARSEICAREVAEAIRLGKRTVPVLCRPLEDAAPPAALADLNYIFFYDEPRSPGSGFGSGLVRLVTARAARRHVVLGSTQPGRHPPRVPGNPRQDAQGLRRTARSRPAGRPGRRMTKQVTTRARQFVHSWP